MRTSETSPLGVEYFTWNTESSVPQLLTDGENAYIYGPPGTPLGNAPVEQIPLSSSATPGSSTYLFSDPQGVRLTFNSSGTITAGATYSAYGQVTSGGLSSITPFGYAGGYTDPTGLIYLINRYYDPSTGQFLSVDPLVGITDQPYQYVGGDPLNFIDPLGLCLSGFGWACEAVHAVTHFARKHWRGIAQGAAIVAGAVAAAGCIAATAGVCAGVVGTVLTVGGIGGLTGDAVYSVSGDPLSLGGYAKSFGFGALGGFAAAGCGLSVSTLCATALGTSTFNGLVGGILSDVAYQSDNCQLTLGGFASAFLVGLLQSEPVPIPESWLP